MVIKTIIAFSQNTKCSEIYLKENNRKGNFLKIKFSALHLFPHASLVKTKRRTKSAAKWGSNNEKYLRLLFITPDTLFQKP